MKPYRKIYIETTNRCNLNCVFCPGTRREPRMMTPEEFSFILDQTEPLTDFVYLHLMGEPLLNPALFSFADAVFERGLKLCLTTNGTLLGGPVGDGLIARIDRIHKINISLQAEEANALLDRERYIARCTAFGKAVSGRCILVYRLWNEGGLNADNGYLLAALHEAFPGDWEENTRGYRLAERTFLEFGERFDWPDEAAPEVATQDGAFYCYGLKDQFGILVDGTVVPCCLDHEGDIALGNIFTENIGTILKSPRAVKLAEGFRKGHAEEALCRRCGYATRFVKS